MSNNQVKIKCELFKRTNEFNNAETLDLKLELTNFTRDDLLYFLTELHGSIAKDYGIEIDPILELHAEWMCDISLYEQRLEVRINEMLLEAAFKPYMSVFNKFGFGLRVRSRLLTRIYPFESFLGVNGRPVIEYEVREVK